MFRVLLMAVLIFVSAGAALARGPARDDRDKPPAGIVPTSESLAAILAAHDRAVGRPAPGTKDTTRERWTFTDMGLSGTEVLVRSGTDYHSIITAGPFNEEYGQVDGRRWHRNNNGITSSIEDDDARSFTMLRVLEDAADPKNDVKVLGEVAAPKPAYVLEIRRPGLKHPEWVFYDKATSLVARVDTVSDDFRLSSVYDDYRTTSGLTQPWHVRDSYTESYLDDEWQRASMTVGEQIDRKDLAEPARGRSIADFTGQVSLPANIVYGTVVLRVNVNGRGLDFSLSTDAPRSIIDRDVARELNLPTFGQVTKSNGGEPVGYKTVLAQADLGPLHLHDFVMRALPFHYHANDATKIVGVLGYDVLAGAVMHIDYVKGKVELIDARQFDSESLNGKPAVLPLKIIDGVPFCEGRIGQTTAKRLIIDNDSDVTVVFGAFSTRYPDDVKDESGRRHADYVVPFADRSQYGLHVESWIARPTHFVFGPVDFATAHFFATNYPLQEAGQDVDGIVGADVLGFYDVYVDFPHDRVVLVPNDFFFKAFRTQKR